MSWMMNDLICRDCGYEEYEAMYKRVDGPDNCPECGTCLSVDFRGMRFAVHGQGPGSFAPVDFGVLGKAETREDYDRCVKTIEERFPGHSVVVEHDSHSQKMERIEEKKHKTWSNRKARGIDPAMVREMTKESKVRVAEKKANAKPNA